MPVKQRKHLFRTIDRGITRFEKKYLIWLKLVSAVLAFYILGSLLWQAPIAIVSSRMRSSPSPQNSLTLKERLDEENSIRTTLAQILGGAVLLFGFYFTYRTVKAAERNTEISRDGQITDRYTRAIEQFGSEKREIRLGGIYALERIAGESERDHWPIIEVLMAYLHEHTPKPEEEIDVKPEPEITAIIKVLGRREWEQEAGKQILVFNHLYLRHLDMTETHFEGASFWSADLGATIFEKANLDFAIFHYASLYNCNFTDARVREAMAVGADVRHASFIRAKAEGIQLSGSQLLNANLEKGDFRKAKLDKVDFTEAYLLGTDFRGANLSETNFKDAKLDGANLRGVDLTQSFNLTKEQISAALTDINTLLPANMVGKGDMKTSS